MPIRLRYLLKCFSALIRVSLYNLRRESSINSPQTLLIVKTDAIGDYLLFRNFLQEIRNSTTFRGFKIVYCGNEIYKDLAQEIDAAIVDEFIWMDRGKFVGNASYRSDFLKQIASMQFHTVINAIYSRVFLVDDLITCYANAEYKIGHQGDNSNDYRILKFISNNWYTQLINSASESILEFYRNKKFIEVITSSKLQTKLALPLINQKTQTQTIIIFPGAGEKQKQWSPDYFAQVIIAINAYAKCEFIICGSQADAQLGDYIINKCNSDLKIKNACGQTSLVQLIQFVQNARLLISNDSSAVHIAACMNTPTICIANGRHFGRFLPYPQQISKSITCLFPPKTQGLERNDPEKLQQLTKLRSLEDINKVSPELVIENARRLLSNAHPSN